jgi:uncharacterized RDD family membrane protein YckC
MCLFRSIQRRGSACRIRRARRKRGALSTLHTASLFPTWKEEVNRRVADHMSRKNASAPEPHPEAHIAPTGRAARAVARVTARYAGAPSYSQMLAEEARAAMRAAQVAHRAAEDAHAAVQMVLAGIEAASAAEPELASGPQLAPAPQRRQESPAVRVGTPAAVDDAAAVDPEIELFAEMHLAPLQSAPSAYADAGFSESDFDRTPQPIPANLLQFPREMVATRRLRPRRIEGPLAEFESAPPQLSIFEVDPGAISTQPTAPAVNEPAAPDWMIREATRPEWATPALQPQTREERIEEPEPVTASPVIDLAPLQRRLLAIVIDTSLTLAAFAVFVRLAAPAAAFLHSQRVAEVCAVLALMLACAGYQALFANSMKTTPGMWYAGIGLCTLEGYVPERRQRCARLLALLLSVLPLGMGLAWSLFDEDRLTWHDRLSGTYLRLR